MVIICIMIMFGIAKFTHLWEKYNPDISFVKEDYAFTQKDKFNLKSSNFKLAFTVENYATSELRIDPSYVKYVVMWSYF